MRHAHRHAQTRISERRRRLAVEAARLISEHGIRDYHQAKLKAAERLGIRDDASLPRNREIQDALREHQRLFLGDSHAQLLRERLEVAAQALEFFDRFDPRLVGAVLEGTADAHSAVCLHLFDDDPESVVRYLSEHGIPYEQQKRRLRLDTGRSDEFPVLLFAAEGTPIDLTILPRDALRQAPLDRIDERPMRRASLSAVRQLLLEQDMAQHEGF
ncbi:MAG TPA: hypothetical protein VFG21_04585 [Xanthomonadaceae bacterium]|nr:hypothetical protein [Xanthomonadaceae bacterium]